MKLLEVLKKFEFFSLVLMILTLASLEAPKNIFLVTFVLFAFFRQFKNKELIDWDCWDWIFLSILVTAFLSTVFAGMPNLGEWKGYRVLLTMIGVGWLVSRSGYSKQEMSFLFGLTIVSAIPPLLWGGYELYYLKSKPFLQLYSVGHVNHSAIYLTMLFGSSLGWILALWSRVGAMSKSLMTLVSSLFFVSLIIGQSRAALGVGMVIALVLIVFLNGDKRIKLGALVCLTILSLSAVFFNAEIVKKELVQEKNNDILSGRDKVWNVSLEAARFHPLLGIGMSNWGYIKQEDIKKSLISRGKSYDPKDYYTHPGHSHSLYLTALVDRGFIGLFMTFIFLIYWVQYIKTTFSLTKLSAQAAYLWSGSFSALLVTFGIGLVNTTFHHEHGILACLLLGLHINYCRTMKKSQK